jgi:phospholipid-binding lipoprotein MlaA
MKNIVWVLAVLIVCLSSVAVSYAVMETSSSNHEGTIQNGSSDVDKPFHAQIEPSLSLKNDEKEEFSDDGEEDLDYMDEDQDYLEEDEIVMISDPLEPVNRAFFHFNDRLYFWLVKPVAKGYSAVVPEDARISVRNFFDNISTPVRLINNLLQGKVDPAGKELIRFGVNTTFGILGLFDAAKSEFAIPMHDADFGQTIGVWGAGPGIFLTWPVLGPSTVRDSVGFIGDWFLEPVNYVTPTIDRIAIKAGDRINRTSLSLGNYEEIKKDALDPYDAVKDIYFQYRKSKIER